MRRRKNMKQQELYNDREGGTVGGVTCSLTDGIRKLSRKLFSVGASSDPCQSSPDWLIRRLNHHEYCWVRPRSTLVITLQACSPPDPAGQLGSDHKTGGQNQHRDETSDQVTRGPIKVEVLLAPCYIFFLFGGKLIGISGRCFRAVLPKSL